MADTQQIIANSSYDSEHSLCICVTGTLIRPKNALTYITSGGHSVDKSEIL